MSETKSTLVGCVTILAETFGKTVSPNLFKAYELGLRDLTVEQIKTATHQALQSCRFMPAPAELREMVFVRTEDRSVKAWLAFEAAVGANGYIKTVSFDDPIINATVKALGGWQHCCGMPAAEFDTFLQKRFQDTYCALSRAGVSAEQAAPLVGWFDQQNSRDGFAAQNVIEIDTGLPPKLDRVARPTSPAIVERPADLPKLDLMKP